MSLSAADIAFATDLFRPLPDLSSRKMFGGLAYYSAGVIFALLRSDGQILIKSQTPEFSDKLAAAGASQWTTTRANGTVSAMPYWTLPDDALDDPDTALALASEALSHLP